MATITPSASSGSPLITPGFPMVSVPMSNPAATIELAAGTVDGQENATKQEMRQQSGHDADRSA